MTVLIIEDNEDNRRLFSKRLKASGHEPHEAPTAAEGLLALQSLIPDLVLLDIHLPDMSGLEVATLIRQNSDLDQCRLVACTAQAMYGDRERAMAAGFDAYISKPLNIRTLPEQLEEIAHGAG